MPKIKAGLITLNAKNNEEWDLYANETYMCSFDRDDENLPELFAAMRGLEEVSRIAEIMSNRAVSFAEEGRSPSEDPALEMHLGMLRHSFQLMPRGEEKSDG